MDTKAKLKRCTHHGKICTHTRHLNGRDYYFGAESRIALRAYV
jgi:hypothetical protein